MQQPYEGYVCDTEGFYQHYGECWNDAFAMILLFADGLKELMQPIIYISDIKELLEDAPIRKAVKENIEEYLSALQIRFRRHYVNELVRRKTQYAGIGAQRAAGENTWKMATAGTCVLSKKFGSTYLKSNIKSQKIYAKSSQIGGTDYDIEDILTVLANVIDFESNNIRWTRIEPTISVPYRQDTKIFDATALSKVKQSAITGLWMSVDSRQYDTVSHIVAFYTCGGNDYYYENNRGPILYPWRDLLEASKKPGVRIGFIDTKYLPCVKQRTQFYPIAYRITQDETDGRLIHIEEAVYCSDRIYRKISESGSIDIKLPIWEVTNVIAFIKEDSLFRAATEPAPEIFPRYIEKGGSRMRNRSKRRTRKH